MARLPLPVAHPGGQADATPAPTSIPDPGSSGGSSTVNNYYGINCGDVANPCHVTVDSVSGLVSITSTDSLTVSVPYTTSITGTVAVSQTATMPIYTVPVMTPLMAGSLMFALFLYWLSWPLSGSDIRLVLAGVALVCAFLAVMSGSPQYLYGFMSLDLGLMFWQVIGAIRARRNPKGGV